MSERPVVVVGAGIAGMTVALSLAPRPVLLLSRTRDGSDGATRLAQGGIAAALARGDSAEEHARDTLAAGGGDNDRGAVRILTEGAADAVGWLERQGLAFDRDRDGWQFAREGGHRRARVLHAGGDATGERIARVLQERIRRADHVQWNADADVDAILRRGDRAAGVGARKTGGLREAIPAAAVVLATGGLGGLFAATSNPEHAQGAGLALGLQAGAARRDLALVQFHPTALAIGAPGSPRLPLLTEALRGAGAVLRDGDGCEIMRGEHPLADLAPRDVVARRIWRLQQHGRAVFLDATGRRLDWSRSFPTVLASCREAGLDPQRQWLPITPAAHFHMGGLAVDIDGATTVPGLYAVGEVACNGVHGGNRLASNSLLEGVVFGRRLAQALLAAPLPPSGRGRMRCLARGPGANRAELDRLRQCLWQGLGPVRDGHGLRRAEQRVRASPTLAHSWQGQLAIDMLQAAQQLRMNRGAHFRLDADSASPRR